MAGPSTSKNVGHMQLHALLQAVCHTPSIHQFDVGLGQSLATMESTNDLVVPVPPMSGVLTESGSLLIVSSTARSNLPVQQEHLRLIVHTLSTIRRWCPAPQPVQLLHGHHNCQLVLPSQ